MKEPRDSGHIEWLIKNEEGKISGPYSTEAVLKLISQNIFDGTEQVSLHPGGKWIDISREPKFYDQLLNVLEGVVGKSDSEVQNMHAETVVQASPKEITKKANLESDYDSERNFDEDEFKPSRTPLLRTSTPNVEIASQVPQNVTQTISSNKKTERAGPIIDLEDLKKVKQQNIKKSAQLPVIFVGLAIVLAALAYVLQDSPSEDKIHLIAPGPASGTISAGDLKANLNGAIGNFIIDRFENYMDAQNQLVRLVERAPQNTEVRGYLCLVYKELWPFAYQDSQDLRTLAFLAQSTRALAPLGVFGSICESVRMYSTGRHSEAKSIVESALNDPEYGKSPLLHQIYGEIIMSEKDYKVASAWIDKAQQLWPLWIKPKMTQAQIQNALGRFSEASQLYREVLSKVPTHKAAKIELALIEKKEFRQIDRSFDLLSSAFNTPGRVSRITEAQGYFALADIYLIKGDRKRALEFAQKSHSLNSTNKEVQDFIVKLGGGSSLQQASAKNSEMVFLGDQYFRAGDYFAAQAEFKAAFEADPKNAAAAMKAAQSLWKLNQGKEAINFLEKAIRADPKLVSAYVIQADYHSQRYDYLSAARVLSRARTMAPNSPEVLRGFALVELRRNNFTPAITYAKKALSMYDTDVETLLILAKAYLGGRPIRDSQEAKDAFRYAVKAVELDSTNREAQIVYGKVLVRIQGFDIGVDYLKKLIANYPYVLDYRLALAEVNADDERYSQASIYYQQVVDVEPNNKQAWIGLGKALQEQGQMDTALRAYLRAATLDPTDAEALFHAGRLYLDMGKYQIAVTQFERVLNINKLIPKTHFYMGRAALLSGDLPKALAEAKNEKRINPSLADAYILAAEAYALNRQYTQCATEYQQAVKLRPQGAEMYVKMSRCYRLAGSMDVALAMLQVAKEKESGYADIYKELGLIYEDQGDRREALAAYDNYLALSPNALDKKEIEARIAKLEGR